MRVVYTKKKECRKDRSACNTIGARYLPKNTVLSFSFHYGVVHKGTGTLYLHFSSLAEPVQSSLHPLNQMYTNMKAAEWHSH
jgi:hypothetical protein